MRTEPFGPQPSRVTAEKKQAERVVLVVVPEGVVRADIKNLAVKGVPVHDEVVTVEYSFGDNDMALADYTYADGVYRLVKKYDANVHWPETVAEAGGRPLQLPSERADQTKHGVPFLVKTPTRGPSEFPPLPPITTVSPPPPVEVPPIPPPPPSPVERPAFETQREWDLLGRYWRLVAQIEDAQLKIEQAKVTGQEQEIPIQSRRLEIGQKNLEQFLGHHPEYRDLPKPMEIPKVDLSTTEGRERARSLLLGSNLPPVEAGKRILATHKADAKIDLVHPVVDKGVGTSAVRPPLKTILTDLKEAQYLVGRLNSVGLFSQLQNAERRHNNLLRLKSTRQSLEYLLKRFSPPPHTEPNLSRDFLSLVHGLVDAVKKLEEGTGKGFLSRWWSQNELTEQNKKIVQGLKKLDQFMQEHRQFA